MVILMTFLTSKTIATMKKMIKNLMLVAVAAMAFVGCQQDIEVNSITKKTTIDFIASFDTETRSQFVEDTDGDNVFQSVWNGGEEVLLFADAGNSVYATGTATMSTEDGTTGTFTAVFDGDVPAAGVVKAYVPASAWNVWSEAITIPAIQTPTEHSVDAAAHILRGEVKYNDITAVDGSDMMFTHAVAYGKMTISDMALENINSVNVIVDDASYTISPEKLKEPTFWFACNADDNVNTLRIEVKNGIETYARTYEFADGKFAFNNGRVSVFSVKNLELVPADYNVVLTKLKSVYNNSFSFVGEDENDRLVIDFNPNLTIGAETYKYASYYSGAPEYNRAQFNISSAYSENYDYWCYDDIVIADKGEGIYDIAIYTTAYISGSTKSVKITYTGKLEAEKVDLTVVSATATLGTKGGDNNYYTVSFTLSNNDVIALEMRTDGKNYLTVGTYTNDWSSYNGGIYPGYINYVYYNNGSATFNSCEVAYDETTLYTVKFGVNGAEFTYTGAIEGLDAPIADSGDEEMPEFTIPGEGGTYTYDYRYTNLVNGLDQNNSMRVSQANGYTWDIKFNTDLTSIEAGDYTAVQNFTSTTALEVDTYNGGFQIATKNYIYPDEYDKVTTFNVQKEGDFYCITMIGSGGYGSEGASYRCVYIGKIK